MRLSHHLHIIILLSASILAAGSPSIAQDTLENSFISFTRKDGLSHNIVTGMAQDSIGYIWISTRSGLNRFNGCNFVQFHSGDDSLTIPEEYLSGLVWLDKHRLAAYTGGLHIIDTHTGETRNLFIPYSDEQYQYKFNSIMAVSGNEEGDIFVLTRSGFYHYDRNYHLVFRYDHYSKEEVATTAFGFGRFLLSLEIGRAHV